MRSKKKVHQNFMLGGIPWYILLNNPQLVDDRIETQIAHFRIQIQELFLSTLMPLSCLWREGGWAKCLSWVDKQHERN